MCDNTCTHSDPTRLYGVVYRDDTLPGGTGLWVGCLDCGEMLRNGAINVRAVEIPPRYLAADQEEYNAARN